MLNKESNCFRRSISCGREADQTSRYGHTNTGGCIEHYHGAWGEGVVQTWQSISGYNHWHCYSNSRLKGEGKCTTFFSGFFFFVDILFCIEKSSITYPCWSIWMKAELKGRNKCAHFIDVILWVTSFTV